MYDKGIIKAILCFCIGLIVGAGALTAAEIPWPLTRDDNGEQNGPAAEYLKNLGKEPREAVIALDKQLRERIAEDRKIVAAGGPGKDQAEKEIERYDAFLSKLSEPARYDFNGKIDLVKKSMTFDFYTVFVDRRTTKVMRFAKDKKYYFFGSNGEPEFLRGKNLELAKEQIQRMGYISHFCGRQDPDPGQEYMQLSSKAAVCCNFGRAALKNNSLDAVIVHPMPAKGPLHDALAKEAMACARTVRPNAVDVVIGQRDWEIQRNAFGVIIRRVCWGWIIVKDDIGLCAIPARWCQDNQGGNEYGRLQMFRHGGNSWFYVKKN